MGGEPDVITLALGEKQPEVALRLGWSVKDQLDGPPAPAVSPVSAALRGKLSPSSNSGALQQFSPAKLTDNSSELHHHCWST